ncbi:hypothetical protein VNO77_37080 [Canavalia gladiata]|uniref:Uncharacterized protein n=1 Tax=Canavalia gladiata TaxID=3824 RepID=A0AAN9PWX6_CANGL
MLFAAFCHIVFGFCYMNTLMNDLVKGEESRLGDLRRDSRFRWKMMDENQIVKGPSRDSELYPTDFTSQYASTLLFGLCRLCGILLEAVGAAKVCVSMICGFRTTFGFDTSLMG